MEGQVSMEFETKNNLNEEVENTAEEQTEVQVAQAEIGTEIIENEIEKIEDKIEAMGWFIRDKSFERKICNAEDFLEEPFLLDVEELLNSIDELKEREDFEDIYMIKGESAIYLFSEKYITHAYADMMVMVEEKDLLKLVADTVRKESKTYPRPTPTKLFSHKPFKLSKEELHEILEQLKNKEEYMDIKETKASNGALYLYSDKFMTKVHASSLAEWVEVEREQNP